MLKSLKHKYYLILVKRHKYVVQFTDLASTIFRDTKGAKLTFSNMPVLHTIQ